LIGGTRSAIGVSSLMPDSIISGLSGRPPSRNFARAASHLVGKCGCLLTGEVKRPLSRGRNCPPAPVPAISAIPASARSRLRRQEPAPQRQTLAPASRNPLPVRKQISASQRPTRSINQAPTPASRNPAPASSSIFGEVVQFRLPRPATRGRALLARPYEAQSGPAIRKLRALRSSSVGPI
jgi:hypothetical protein